MHSISVIGHFSWKHNETNGAVIKARSIFYELKKLCPVGCTVNTVDIAHWRKSFLFIALRIAIAFITNRNIVLVSSDTNRHLLLFIHGLSLIFRNNVVFCVVGSNIGSFLEDNTDRVRQLKFYKRILVETNDCVKIMQKLGLTNTMKMRNFKQISPLDKSSIRPYHDEVKRYCIFSRVTSKKGVTDAILAVEEINEAIGSQVCRLDIYGQIDDNYSEDFSVLLSTHKSSSYCGIIEPYESVSVLKDYYCLLFPTKYQTEGIPGTIIDSFASGLPVISSDWARCREIVSDMVTGIVYPFGDFDGLKKAIMFSINNPNQINLMRHKCVVAYNDYSPAEAIKPLWSVLI